MVAMLAGTATAQSTPVERVPPQTELTERLAALESLDTELTEDQQRDQAALTAALQAYERLQAIEERQQALEQRVNQAPDQLLRLERELAQQRRTGIVLTA
jgi:potassium efflux system protein